MIYKINDLYDFFIVKNKNININNEFSNLHYFLKYNNTFIVIKYTCKTCGLFTIFNSFLDCINTYINKGYIPILDLKSYPNIFNGFNVTSLNKNPWEYYFEQPFGLSLETITKKAQNIIYSKYNNKICRIYGRKNIFYNKATLDFWHNIAMKYIPIKNDIINESNLIIKKYFRESKNILGILMRGTDYIAKRPKNHPIQPKPEKVINDVIKAFKRNHYDFIFLTTEDHLILQKFINIFGNKLKYLENQNINYNYTEKKFLGYNKNILGNLNYQKIYLINIIILSKCIDIICSKAGGTFGAIVLSKGFRYIKLYNLGRYK